MVDGSRSNRSWSIPVGEFTRSVGRNETFQGVSVMMGVVVFHSVGEAIRQGFQIYGKTADGYIARIMTTHGWAMALIDLKQTG
jgi:hypothetical protein